MPKEPTTQREWLEAQIARLETDAATVEDGETSSGLTLEEQSQIEQYRFELSILVD